MHPLIKDTETGVHYRKWDTPATRAVLLLVHGMGAHSERWRFLAEYMFAACIKSYAVELSGFGETPGAKGHVNSLKVYFDEILALRDIILREDPRAKIFLAGESLGGLVAFLAAAGYPRLFSGVICISPAFVSRLKFRPVDYVLMLLAFLFSPKKHFKMPFNSSMVTRDEMVLETMETDHREHRVMTARSLFEIGMGQLRSKWAAKHVDVPVLFQQAGEDRLVDPAATEKIFKAVRSDDKTIKVYPGMYHALTIDTGREEVFQDMYRWLRERV